MSVEPPKQDTSPGWLESLYREKAAGLILYGRALGLSHQESEDVLQETFVALLGLSERPANPNGYCLKAFRNHAINYRRGLWRRIAREFASQEWFEQDDTQDVDEQALMRMLATLPCDQREAIVLKIWHCYTFEDIGEIAGVSPNTAAGRYRYGLEKLRNSLKKGHYANNERFGEALALLDTQRSIRQD